MEKKLIYLCKKRMEELNEYEREEGKISYNTLLKYYDMTPILCNNIAEVDEYLFDNIEVGNIYDEENDCYIDIYQYFIINLSAWELENIKKYYNDELIIAYSEKLDNYILLVDHFGTSWDYVLTNIEFTDDIDKIQQWEKEQEEQGEY